MIRKEVMWRLGRDELIEALQEMPEALYARRVDNLGALEAHAAMKEALWSVAVPLIEEKEVLEGQSWNDAA